MLDIFKTLFKENNDAEPQLAIELAAAALMFEVMWADHDVEAAELKVMRQYLQSAFDMDAARLDDILRETKELHDASVGLHEFTRALNDNASQAQKKEIVGTLWQIAFADHQIDALEEHMIRRIADLLYVSHKDFIQAKLAARPD